MPIVFDGRLFSATKEKVLQRRIREVSIKLGRKPKLVAICLGEEKDIQLYISMKEKAAQRLGVDFEIKIFNEDLDENHVLDWVRNINNDSSVDGILLELPIPKKFSVTKIMNCISFKKDPDCMTAENLGKLLFGDLTLMPATVRAVVEIIEYQVKIQNSKVKNETQNSKVLKAKSVVVVGGGVELGKPLSMVLSDMGATVTLCRSSTRDLSEFTKNADIIISAVGVPGLVTGKMVKVGVAVIDCGINLVNGKTQGDVDFDSVSKKASFITPVPGGVGPVTIVSLFENLMDSILPISNTQ